MAYKFNPFLGGLDNTVSATAFTILGTEATFADIPLNHPTPSSGDVWQAADTGIFWVYDASSTAWESLGTLAGPAGPAGATGPTGADGQTILNGSGAPVDNVTGTDGDFYIDTSAHTIYGPRTAGAWGTGTSLIAGGATTLGGLNDVDLTTSPPTNNQALVYDSANSEWIPGAAGASAVGALGDIQYNDGSNGLAASADLNWDNTNKELGVGGDLNLDSGGPYSTTIQSVTPTANRTISFPDQTGTVGLVSGATGNIQFNDAGKLAGSGDFNVQLDWATPTTAYTGLKLNATQTGGANSNASTNLLDLQVDGTTKLKFDRLGINYGVASAITTYIGLGGTFGATSGFRLYGDATTLRFASNHIVGWTANATESFTTLDTALTRDSAGVVAITDGSSGTGYLRQVPITVASLPAAAAGNAGTRIFVSDSSVAAAGNFGGVVSGGGANTVPVYSDGGAWRIG